jgi:hypothetical protein
MPEKRLLEEDEPRFCLEQYQLDKLHEFVYGLDPLASITKCDEHKNIGFLIEIICNRIVELSQEIAEQKLEGGGGAE